MMCTNQMKLLVFFGVVVALTNANNLKVGDACQIAATGDEGTCKFLAKCSAAKDDLNFKGILPTECGYDGYNKIVCCPKPVVATISSKSENRFGNEPISVQKCREYSQYVYHNISLVVGLSTTTKKTDRCGHKAVPLILGGTPAVLSEFPHSALLGFKQSSGEIKWDCGGSLISRRYVLTAAHCLVTRDKIEVSHVRLGELVLDDETDGAQVIDIPIERRIKFPEYLKSKKYDDIALLKLNHKVELSPFIRPICLPTDNLDPPKVIASGWGDQGIGLSRSNALLKVVLELYNNEECNNKYESYTHSRSLSKGIIDTQICFGSRTVEKDTCQGDSGGPLQIYHQSIYCMYTQIGVTSVGVECGSVDFPGLYTKVNHYVPWIESIVWADGEDD